MINVHIDELALEGFDADAGDRVSDAIQRELQRLAAKEGPPSAGAHDAVDAGTFDGSDGPEAAGVRVARAIHGGQGSRS